MTKARQSGTRSIRCAHAWLRPVTYGAAVAAAVAALFQPIPAMATPGAPAVPAGAAAPAVPDSGSRPVPLGTLVLPGATPASSPTTATAVNTAVPANPVVQLVEKGRAEVAALGDQLIRATEDRDLAQQQLKTAQERLTVGQQALREAEAAAADAATDAMQKAAALPPGLGRSELFGLGDLARIQQGQETTDDAAARRLEAVKAAVEAAQTEQSLAGDRLRAASDQWTKLNTQLVAKQAAQKKLEERYAAELTAAELTESNADRQLGSEYLAGSTPGRGADPRAVGALQYALAQRGDPYVWSEEGPDRFDCSGLMWAAYRSVGFQLTRVSRDQYWQTRNKVVDRYSLLPGDLLFFSSSNSWTGIHHVAMYAGDGLMVEAPRSGLTVRLVPVRWSRLFQATRVFGSVEGGETDPDIGTPDPEEPGVGSTTRPPTSSATPKPSKTTKPPTNPKPSSGSSSPTGGNSSSPTGGSSSPTGGSSSPTGGSSSSPTGGSSSSPTGGSSSAPTGGNSSSPTDPSPIGTPSETTSTTSKPPATGSSSSAASEPAGSSPTTTSKAASATTTKSESAVASRSASAAASDE